MDQETARQQIDELRISQAKADDEALSEPKGFRIPFLVSLWLLLAAADFPSPWSVVIEVIAGVSTLALLVWMIRSRKSRMRPERFMKAVAAPTLALLVAALVVVTAANVALSFTDFEYRNIFVATTYVAFCVYGFQKANEVSRRNLAQLP